MSVVAGCLKKKGVKCVISGIIVITKSSRYMKRANVEIQSVITDELPFSKSATSMIICFFFQAEDGIRYFHVTGVQTCALPISMAYGLGLIYGVLRIVNLAHGGM